jgi:hypothetical protein
VILFMSKHHLIDTLPRKWIRFLPGEVVLRWPIHPDQLPLLDGTPAQLIALLRETLDVSPRRASDEVDQFVRELKEKMQRASELPKTILGDGLAYRHASVA